MDKWFRADNHALVPTHPRAKDNTAPQGAGLCKYLILLLCAAVAFVSCAKRDHSGEAMALVDELVDMAISDLDKALERVDSAEQAGLFTAAHANTVRAIIYENADRRRMATYYAEKAIAAETGHTLATHADSNFYCTARLTLADCAFANGEYGKSLALAKDILDFTGDGTAPQVLAMKCKALSQMADCEGELNHVDEAERLFLQCVDILMESTKHTPKCRDTDPLIYTLLALNDLYIDHKMPERALPLTAKLDTALNRLMLCHDIADWVVQMRRNNVTISKAIVYAANGQWEQAEALFQEHRQYPGLDAPDKMAEGAYLTMTERYDEAVRMFDEADSIVRSGGDPITDIYIKTLFKYKYDTLLKAGRTSEALDMGEYIRQLTDSIRQQERQADVEQLQEIQWQEEEIVRKHQSLLAHRTVLVATVVLLLMAIYIIWRVHRYNRLLAEKNRSLYEQIQQREQAEAEEHRQLQAQPVESLTAEQQLYRRLCTLMTEQQPYTDENLNRDTLAQLLGTNAKYVVQAIHECSHGDTVTDFITRYRLENVARLLKTTDEPISLIGELSGIPSRTTLSRLFRNAYGMTCREYRQVAQQK